MKSAIKLFAGLAVVAAMAVSAGPSEAAKKKAAAAKCDPLRYCSVCQGSSCTLKTCSPDGKLYDSLIVRTCKQPDCPAKC